MTTSAFPDLRIMGKVAYIDPQVRSETRTAKIRIEVAESGAAVRLGCTQTSRSRRLGDGPVRARPAIIGPEPRRPDGGLPLRSPCAGPIHRARGAPWVRVSEDRVVVLAGVQPGDSRRYVRQLLASSRTRTTGAQGTTVRNSIGSARVSSWRRMTAKQPFGLIAYSRRPGPWQKAEGLE